MASNTKIFRESALNRLSDPEQLDKMLTITQPRSWAGLLGLIIMLALGIVWGAVGSIPIETNEAVVFVKTGGPRSIVAAETGILRELHVAVGDTVAQNQPIAELDMAGRLTTLVAHQSGLISELPIAQGELVQEGGAVAIYDQVGDAIFQEAVLFVTAAEAAQLQTGMAVQLSHATGAIAQQATVQAIGAVPLTAAQAERLVGNQMRLNSLAFEPGHVAVTVRLDGPAASATEIPSGTFGSARIVRGDQRPLDFLLPGLFGGNS